MLTRRPQLLFLCQTLPYPPDGGVWIRTYHVLRLLARAFDITALCFERSASSGSGSRQRVGESLEALSRFATVEMFEIPQRHSRIRYGWDHVRSAACRQAYTRYLYESRAFRRRLRELVRSRAFDLVHVDSFDLAAYFRDCAGLPVVCVHHDVESDQLRRRADIERSTWRSAYLRYQARLTEDLEREWCDRIELNVAVSEADRAVLQRFAPAARVAVVPNGVDIDEFQPDGTVGHGAAFVGGTNWFPNRDALEFFCDSIWPLVKAARPDLPVRWIGNATADERLQYRDRHGVELTGYVSDVRPSMREAACHIVPLRAGSGTRLKILNSWAMGKPVVSTSIGCEGLAAVDGENILIRDNPQDFASAILTVLDDAGLRRRLGERGRATAERLYGWDVVGRDMINTYFAVADAAVSTFASAIAAAGPEPGYGRA
jgi:glycosyltransferase involved in cell wall biosynthesis